MDQDYQQRKMRAQFRAADRLKAKYVAILGEEELEQGKVKLRQMESGEEEEIDMASLVATMKEKRGGEQ